MSDPKPASVSSAAQLFSSESGHLQAALPAFLVEQRWFAGKSAGIASVGILDTLPVADSANGNFWLLLAEVILEDQSRQQYVLPLSVVSGEGSDGATIMRMVETDPSGESYAVVEASAVPEFWAQFIRRAVHEETAGDGSPLKFVFEKATPDWLTGGELAVAIQDSEQSNTSVIINGRHFLKLFRRPTAGINPDVEVGVALTDAGFAHSPAVTGHVDYVPTDGPPVCLALISELVQAASDAWAMTLSRNDEFWQQLFLSQKLLEATAPRLDWSVASHAEALPDDAELLGQFVEEAERLGRRTAEMHTALAGVSSNSFCPEVATEASLKNHLAVIRREAEVTASLLASVDLPDEIPSGLAERVRERTAEKLAEFEQAVSGMSSLEIRVHGDYHLGQVLFAEDDFVIIDFEGEPDRPIEERRQKHNAMKDVAGMVRSLHYAASAGAAKLIPALDDRSIPENVASWQQFWFACSARSFLHGYLKVAAGQLFLPETDEQTQQMLDLYLLEKVLYELRYELNNRPDWVAIPLAGLQDVLGL